MLFQAASRNVVRTSFLLMANTAENVQLNLSRNMGLLTVRDMSGVGMARGMSAGVGAGAAVDVGASVRLDRGLWGFSAYVPPAGGVDTHAFFLEAPEGTVAADDVVFHGNVQGEYNFHLAHQLTMGDWPGKVVILYADFPSQTNLWT
jgi:hypothetical protein